MRPKGNAEVSAPTPKVKSAALLPEDLDPVSPESDNLSLNGGETPTQDERPTRADTPTMDEPVRNDTPTQDERPSSSRNEAQMRSSTPTQDERPLGQGTPTMDERPLRNYTPTLEGRMRNVTPSHDEVVNNVRASRYGTPTQDESPLEEKKSLVQKLDYSNDSQLSGISDLSSHVDENFHENHIDSKSVWSTPSPKTEHRNLQFDNFMNLTEKIKQAEMTHGQVSGQTDISRGNIAAVPEESSNSSLTNCREEISDDQIELPKNELSFIKDYEDFPPQKDESVTDEGIKIEMTPNNSNCSLDSKTFVTSKIVKDESCSQIFFEDSLSSSVPGTFKGSHAGTPTKESEYMIKQPEDHSTKEAHNGCYEPGELNKMKTSSSSLKLESKDSSKTNDTSKHRKHRESSSSSKYSRSSDKYRHSESKHKSSHDRKEDSSRNRLSTSDKEKSSRDEKDKAQKEDKEKIRKDSDPIKSSNREETISSEQKSEKEKEEKDKSRSKDEKDKSRSKDERNKHPSKDGKDKITRKDDHRSSHKDDKSRHKDERHSSSKDRKNREKDKSSVKNNDSESTGHQEVVGPKEKPENKDTNIHSSEKYRSSKDKSSKEKEQRSRSKSDNDKDRQNKEHEKKDKENVDNKNRDKEREVKNEREKDLKNEKSRNEKEKAHASLQNSEKHEIDKKLDKNRDSNRDRIKDKDDKSKNKDDRKKESHEKSRVSSSRKTEPHRSEEKDKNVKSEGSISRKSSESKSEEEKKDRKRRGERCNDDRTSKEARRSSDRDSSGKKGGSGHRTNSDSIRDSRRSDKKQRESNSSGTNSSQEPTDKPSDHTDGLSGIELIISRLSSSIKESENAEKADSSSDNEGNFAHDTGNCNHNSDTEETEKTISSDQIKDEPQNSSDLRPITTKLNSSSEESDENSDDDCGPVCNEEEVPIKKPKIANNFSEMKKIMEARKNIDRHFKNETKKKKNVDDIITDKNPSSHIEISEDNKENIKTGKIENPTVLNTANVESSEFFGFTDVEIASLKTNLSENVTYQRSMLFSKTSLSSENNELLDTNLNKLELFKGKSKIHSPDISGTLFNSVINAKAGCYVLLKRLNLLPENQSEPFNKQLIASPKVDSSLEKEESCNSVQAPSSEVYRRELCIYSSTGHNETNDDQDATYTDVVHSMSPYDKSIASIDSQYSPVSKIFKYHKRTKK